MGWQQQQESDCSLKSFQADFPSKWLPEVWWTKMAKIRKEIKILKKTTKKHNDIYVFNLCNSESEIIANANVMVLVFHPPILFDVIKDAGAHFYTICVNKLSFMVILMSSLDTQGSPLRSTGVLLHVDSDFHPTVQHFILAAWKTSSANWCEDPNHWTAQLILLPVTHRSPCISVFPVVTGAECRRGDMGRHKLETVTEYQWDSSFMLLLRTWQCACLTGIEKTNETKPAFEVLLKFLSGTKKHPNHIYSLQIGFSALVQFMRNGIWRILSEIRLKCCTFFWTISRVVAVEATVSAVSAIFQTATMLTGFWNRKNKEFNRLQGQSAAGRVLTLPTISQSVCSCSDVAWRALTSTCNSRSTARLKSFLTLQKSKP